MEWNRMMQSGCLLLFAGVVTGGFSFLCGYASAQTPTPTFAANVRQLPLLTDERVSWALISGDGSVVVYDDGTNVYLVSTDGREQRALTEVSNGACSVPFPNRDGSRVAMRCSADVTGQNPDGNAEVVLLRGNEFVPITVSTVTRGFVTQNGFGWITADGHSLVFSSDGNYTGQNPDGNYEVFLWRDGHPLTQVSRGATNASGAISADGRFVFFAEVPPDDRCPMDDTAYWYDVSTGETSPFPIQLPCTPCREEQAAGVNRNYTVFVFTAFTSCDSNGSARGKKLYRQRIGEDPTFLLDVPDGWDVTGVAVNGDGSRIAVIQRSRLDSAWESVLLTPSGRQELPGVPRDAMDLGLFGFDEAGRNLLFTSRENLTGENPQHDEKLFVAVMPLGSDTPLPTFTPPPSPTPTPRTPRPTPTLGPCYGDCNGDHAVRINELVLGVNIALDTRTLAQCPAFDCNGTGRVGVDCLIKAVNATLNGCRAS
jgi:hypothetical protein